MIMIQRKVRIGRSRCMHVSDWCVLIFGVLLVLYPGGFSIYNLTL